MSTGILGCRPANDVADAEKTMRRAQVHRLPVLDAAGQLLGVTLWARRPELAAAIARERRNPVYLDDIALPRGVRATSDLTAASAIASWSSAWCRATECAPR